MRGVARVANGEVAGQALQGAIVEHRGHEAHVLHHHDVLAIRDRHTRGLLPTVLQGVEAVEGEVGYRAPGGEYAEDAAGLFHQPFLLRSTRWITLPRPSR